MSNKLSSHIQDILDNTFGGELFVDVDTQFDIELKYDLNINLRQQPVEEIMFELDDSIFREIYFEF